MNLYPAIDILEGRAVRLRYGRREDVTVYGTPIEMAHRWMSEGARWLHVVDLDGAFAGEPKNARSIEQICSQFPKIRLQVGGGIRTMAAIEAALNAGVERVILGTAAVTDPVLLDNAVVRFGDRITVGIDARDGTARLDGWTRDSVVTALDLAVDLQGRGVQRVVFTDISRDGDLAGINLDAIRAMLDGTDLSVIASGGVSAREDIVRLCELGHSRLDGVVIGKALYEGALNLRDVLRVAEAGHAC